VGVSIARHGGTVGRSRSRWQLASGLPDSVFASVQAGVSVDMTCTLDTGLCYVTSPAVHSGDGGTTALAKPGTPS